MTLFTILIVLFVAAILLWILNTYIPMDRKIRNILNAVITLVVIGWLLKIFGVFDYLQNIKI